MNINSQILQIDVNDIVPNRFQPRLNFDEESLKDLANSIKEHGIIQPLVLRKVGEKYEIIAGERRYRAAMLNNFKTVPGIIANLDDAASAQLALTENIQRQTLTCIEEAKTYQNLINQNNGNIDLVAQKVGIKKEEILSKIQLLKLDESVQQALLNNQISERHARSLLRVNDMNRQKEILDKIIKNRMTVKDLNDYIKGGNNMNTQETEMPIVDLNLNVNEIANKAQDLYPKSDNNSNNTNFTNINSNTVQGSTNNKFFNFLEDEAANLDTGINENPQDNFKKEENQLETIDFTSPSPMNNSIENNNNFSMNQPTNNALNNIAPTEIVNSSQATNSNPSNNSLFNNIFNPVESDTINNPLPSTETSSANPISETVSPSSQNDNNLSDIFNPSLSNSSPIVVPPMETLDFTPSVVPDPVAPIVENNNISSNNVPETTLPSNDISDVINAFRNIATDFSNKGIKIDTEEMDFGGEYQIIIKINK